MKKQKRLFWEGPFASEDVECRLYLGHPKWNTIEYPFSFKYVPLLRKDLLGEFRALF